MHETGDMKQDGIDSVTGRKHLLWGPMPAPSSEPATMRYAHHDNLKQRAGEEPAALISDSRVYVHWRTQLQVYE